MQLIVEQEDTNIDINIKMSTISEETLIEKTLTNGVIQEASDDVPIKNKDDIPTKADIIDDHQQQRITNEQIVNGSDDQNTKTELNEVEARLDILSEKEMADTENRMQFSVESQNDVIEEKSHNKHDTLDDADQEIQNKEEKLSGLENKCIQESAEVQKNTTMQEENVQSTNNDTQTSKQIHLKDVKKLNIDDTVLNEENNKEISDFKISDDVGASVKNDIILEDIKHIKEPIVETITSERNSSVDEDDSEFSKHMELDETNDYHKHEENPNSLMDCDMTASAIINLDGSFMENNKEPDAVSEIRDNVNTTTGFGEIESKTDNLNNNCEILVCQSRNDASVSIECEESVAGSPTKNKSAVYGAHGIKTLEDGKIETENLVKCDQIVEAVVSDSVIKYVSEVTTSENKSEIHDSVDVDQMITKSEESLAPIDNKDVDTFAKPEVPLVVTENLTMNKSNIDDVSVVNTENTPKLTEDEDLNCEKVDIISKSHKEECTLFNKTSDDQTGITPNTKSVDVISSIDNKPEFTINDNSVQVPEPKNQILTADSNHVSGAITVDETSTAENITSMEMNENLVENSKPIDDVPTAENNNVNEVVTDNLISTKELESETKINKDLIGNSEPKGNDSITESNNENDILAENLISAKETPEDNIVDLDNIKDNTKQSAASAVPEQSNSEKSITSAICRLSNTLDILSDDDEEPPNKTPLVAMKVPDTSVRQCIDLEDDDDIMLIDEDKGDLNKTHPESGKEDVKHNMNLTEQNAVNSDDLKAKEDVKSFDIEMKDSAIPVSRSIEPLDTPEINEKVSVKTTTDKHKPLISTNFLKSFKKSLVDMTRDDLEEFCILKIVESIIDRSNLNEINTKLKTMSQNIEEYKKKSLMLTKQNRDLQVVLKSVQEEQKKNGDSPITPLKITRSVGMQVLMTDKTSKRKPQGPGNQINANTGSNINNRPIRNNVNISPRPQSHTTAQQIPVPRLVPATNSSAVKSPNVTQTTTKNVGKTSAPLQNGVKPSPPTSKAVEKRSRMFTVDLTDDEPPAKVQAKSSPAPPVRLVNQQSLIAARPQLAQPNTNSPRKVYIPISGPPGQNVRPGQTIMLKSVPQAGPRPRVPMAPMVRLPQNSVRLPRVTNGRHPAPLPDAMKQYQPPNWKALPPAPDLKLSKVENGIVISWKIDGYQEDSYEEIASYQLYAYQETTQPPSTSLWKKIGDVKALPLPMACTLTQFMAGYKYYFAVRAVDIRSRLGPFSLPGSILLLNKM